MANPLSPVGRRREWLPLLFVAALMLVGGILSASMFWGFVFLLDRQWDMDSSVALIATLAGFSVAFTMLMLLGGHALWRRRFSMRQMLVMVMAFAGVLATGRILLTTGMHRVATSHWESHSLTDFDLWYLRDEFARMGGLTLVGPGITDVGLKRIESLPNVTSIDLRDSSITDNGLESLRQSAWLQELKLTNTNISDTGLEHLTWLESLESLDLRGTRVTDNGMRWIAQIRHLKELQLPAQIGDAGFAALGECQSLTRLNARNTLVGDKGLQTLAKCVTIESLDCGQTSITDEGLRYISRLPLLTKLILSRTCLISDAGIDHLTDATNLESLSLKGCDIGDKSLASLAELPALTSLNLTHTNVTDAGLKHLQDLGLLESLELRGTLVTDQGLLSLRGLSNLRGLSISMTVTDRTVGILQEFKQLEWLILDKRTVSTDALIELNRALPDTDVVAY